jgi:isocitrate/isopropylmalate dehydrogenase
MGTNRANPTAMILSGTMMLRHLGSVHLQRGQGWPTDHKALRLDSTANSIASATFDVINEGKIRTADMDGRLSFTRLQLRKRLIHGLQVLPPLQTLQQPSSSACDLLLHT